MILPLVLIVDDNPENLTIIGELLQPGHAVRAANGGSRALKLAAMDPRPDLILLDVMMPDMDGYEVLSQLRAQPETADIPVVFLTALNSPADEERGLMLGAAEYITKPIRPSVLLARVRTQLELKQARDILRDQGAWLANEVARRVADERQAQDVGLLALARLAEARDPDAGSHVLRTQACVRTLAQTLTRGGQLAGWSAQTVELVSRCVPLHDIGEAAVPEHLLHKPGPLTADEWVEVRGHADAGARALAAAQAELARPIDFIDIARQVARSHHERWDGSGYPDGLAGEAIPLPARLVAVADVFDALLSPRAWRPAFSLDQAYQTIVSGRGQQFDPLVVDAFVDSFSALKRIALPQDGAELAHGTI